MCWKKRVHRICLDEDERVMYNRNWFVIFNERGLCP